MPTYTTLKGFSDITKKQPSEILRDNLIEFLDWSFVNAGGYVNVNIPSSGVYGGRRDYLMPLEDPSYTDGQVWQAHRGNWIWQSGVDLGTPINISGVYVDNTFYPTSTTGDLSHYYDYRNGKVIFDTAISTTAVVQLEYSYKWINVVEANSVPFLRATYDTHRPDNQYTQFGSGEYDLINNRLDFPCVAVHVPPKNGVDGHELGSGARRSKNKVAFHVLSENPDEATRIADVLADQAPKSVYLFNTNTIAESGDLPLDYRGMTVSNPKSYPELVETYKWKKLYFKNANNTNNQQFGQSLYLSTIVVDTEIILTEV